MFSKRLPGCGMKIIHKSNSTEVTRKHSRPARRCFIEYRWNSRSRTSFGNETSDESAATVDVVVVDCFASLVVGPVALASLSSPLSSFAFVSAAQPFTFFFSTFAFILDVRLSRTHSLTQHIHYSLGRCWFFFIVCCDANTLTDTGMHITQTHLNRTLIFFFGNFSSFHLGISSFFLCSCLICSILLVEVYPTWLCSLCAFLVELSSSRIYLRLKSTTLLRSLQAFNPYTKYICTHTHKWISQQPRLTSKAISSSFLFVYANKSDSVGAVAPHEFFGCQQISEDETMMMAMESSVTKILLRLSNKFMTPERKVNEKKTKQLLNFKS